LIREISYNLILLCVGDLGPNLEQEEGEGENRKGLKRLDSHGQVKGNLNTPAAPRPVRPVGAAEPCEYCSFLSVIGGGDGGRWFFDDWAARSAWPVPMRLVA